MNPTVTLAIAINLLSEDDTLGAVLAATPNERFLVLGQDEENALASIPGAPRWKMRQLSSALSGHQTTRAVHVVKSGGRFRLTLNNADGINLAEEAELPFKSFKNFGEIVRRCFAGEVEMGETTPVSAVPGTRRITITLPAGESGTGIAFGQSFENSASDSASVSEGDDPSTIGAALVAIAGDGATVQSATVTEGNITIVLNVPATIITYIRKSDASETWNVVTTAGTDAVPALPANGILLDQVAGQLRFVRVATVPSGTDVATCIRPVTPDSELAFLE